MTTLSPRTIEWAIEHLAQFGDTDIFPTAFEYAALKHCKDDVVKSLSKQDICQWPTRPFRRCLVPKQRYGFRLATQLDPLDMLFYTSLFLETGELIERARLPGAQKISFSNRFLLDNTGYSVFDHTVGYPEFQAHSGELAKGAKYVVVTDIADFYPRVYFHRLEGALGPIAKTLPTHAKALALLIKGWNHNVSYGIPIGSNPSRLLAEIVLDDVDRFLVAERVTFTRFVDDYRIFCNSRQEAYQCLTRLANVLYETNGLTLQSQKTKILTVDEFTHEVLTTEDKKEVQALAESFSEILEKLGIDNPYDEIDFDSLPPEYQEYIGGLNLEGLLEKQLTSDEIDIPMTRFLINRLGQLGRSSMLSRVLSETDKLYPVFTEVIRYAARLTDSLAPNAREAIGTYLLDKLNGALISHLEFHRMQIVSLFAGSNKWGNGDKLAGYYNVASDSWFRRALIVALGRAGQSYWLRAKKSELEQMPFWERRAFLYAASCFGKDEMENYYRAVKPKLDDLGKYVIAWAEKNPIYS